jgi:Holliday junction resolvase
MDHLHDRGWCVIRSAGSHGAADVVAVKPGVVLLVQAKISLERLGSREWTTLYDLSVQAGALAIVAYRPSMRTLTFKRITGPRSLRQRAADLLEAFEP